MTPLYQQIVDNESKKTKPEYSVDYPISSLKNQEPLNKCWKRHPSPKKLSILDKVKKYLDTYFEPVELTEEEKERIMITNEIRSWGLLGNDQRFW